jgi:putative transposase
MPSRNIVKQYTEGYYHIYNRGVARSPIFLDDQDYLVFLSLLKRYLDKQPEKDNSGRTYISLNKEVSLLAFCLLSNHFHLLIYQQDEPKSITILMRCLLTSYTQYFNKKYKRVGHLFQGIFKASLISSDEYLTHISRYIHLNPKNYLKWQWSSLPYYLNKQHAEWVQPSEIMRIFNNSTDEYLTFLKDYEDYKKELDALKLELADS